MPRTNHHSPIPRARSITVFFAAIAALASSMMLIPAATAQNAMGAAGAQTVTEVVIPKNDTNWRYNEMMIDLGTEWRNLDYVEDANWKTGQARFSNTDCCNTLLGVIPFENAVYFRKEFTVTNLADVNEMLVSFQYDDAAILWLNGVEVYRTIRGNLPATGEVPVDYDVMTGGAEDLYVEMPGTNYVEYNPNLGSNLEIYVPAIDTANLREGNNVFAVMLFNRRGSYDTSTDLMMQLVRDASTAVGNITAETSCANNDGRVDVTITNATSMDKNYEVTVGPFDRPVTVAANSTDGVMVTGRPDGPYPITVSESGSVIFEDTVTVSCDPNVELSAESSCLDNNGRLDFYLKNTGSATATYTVTVDGLSPRSQTLDPSQGARVTVTGRPDGQIGYQVDRDGTVVDTSTLTVDCDPNVSGMVATSCMAGNGRIDTFVSNQTTSTNPYEVGVTGLEKRMVMLAPGEQARVTVTGRPDGKYWVMVYEDQMPIYAEEVTIDCDV